MYGLAAVIAVIHDVIVSAGVFMLFGGRLTPTIVAALMAIIGYSLNDTIVIFDRIRETQSLDDSIEYSDLINQSVNQTLSRTIMTTFTTMLATTALLVAAGGDVWDFALVTFYGMTRVPIRRSSSPALHQHLHKSTQAKKAIVAKAKAIMRLPSSFFKPRRLRNISPGA